MPPAKQIIWLSFDLGLRGDYEGLYAWLDQRGAKEWGEALAVLKYEHDGDRDGRGMAPGGALLVVTPR